MSRKDFPFGPRCVIMATSKQIMATSKKNEGGEASARGEAMRLFIAILLENNVKEALTAMQTQLRARRVGGNYTKIENLHLTLAFIGEYGDPERVLDVMRSVRFAPIPIALEGFGCFGDLYWCGLARQDALEAYVRRLRRALAEADIPFDRKRFTPHITLLRKASVDAIPGITVPGAAMTAERVSLMRSERGKGGMLYTELSAADAQGTSP